MLLRLYLDVCCLNRPFDDWTQSRIRLEAEAVLATMEQVEASDWELVSSTALEAEIGRTPDPVKKQRLMDSLAIATQHVTVTEKIFERARGLNELGFKAFDALHVACAEFAKVDVFLTTDDRLLNKARTLTTNLKVRVANPVDWFMEVTSE